MLDEDSIVRRAVSISIDGMMKMPGRVPEVAATNNGMRRTPRSRQDKAEASGRT
jgi:hypothetical protein